MRSLSESALLTLSPKTNADPSKGSLSYLPYESTVPIVYLLDSLRAHNHEIQDISQRRSILTHLLASALDTLEDDSEPDNQQTDLLASALDTLEDDSEPDNQQTVLACPMQELESQQYSRGEV
jgi:hypothetical protein